MVCVSRWVGGERGKWEYKMGRRHGGYLHNLCTAAAHRGVDPFRAHQIASRQRRAVETLDERQANIDDRK